MRVVHDLAICGPVVDLGIVWKMGRIVHIHLSALVLLGQGLEIHIARRIQNVLPSYLVLATQVVWVLGEAELLLTDVDLVVQLSISTIKLTCDLSAVQLTLDLVTLVRSVQMLTVWLDIGLRRCLVVGLVTLVNNILLCSTIGSFPLHHCRVA